MGASFSVLVVQMGGRRGYELASMLESSGCLKALHTNLAWAPGQAPRPFGRWSGSIARRTVHGVPSEKLFSHWLPDVVGQILKLSGVHSEQRYRMEDWLLGFQCQTSRIVQADIVLNTSGNGGPRFLNWAKRQGLKVVTDVVITPRVFEILIEEHGRFPDWEAGSDLERARVLNWRKMRKVVNVSDLLLCPSGRVASDLIQMFPESESKVKVIPYGLGSTEISMGDPVPKRVMFAGSPGLRKGIHYLSEAACILKGMDPGYEIRVAGRVSEQVARRAGNAGLTFLGHLGGKEMAAEYSSADVFCLPSLAEGMASVSLEALAHGVPCVVTLASGAPIRDGTEGFIVAERDPCALVEAIRAIAEDRARRKQMSDAALRRASNHHSGVIAGRIVSALESLL